MRGNLEHNNVTPEMLAQLPFIEGEMQVIMSGSNVKRKQKTADVYKLYKLTLENMEKAKKLLSGDLMPTLPKKSRVYVLPNCMYTQVQIRELCKFHGFTITHDISKADLFVGNDNVVLPNMEDSEFPNSIGCAQTRLYKYEMKDDFAKVAYETRYPGTNIGEGDVYFSRYYYSHIDSWSALHGTDEYYALLSGEGVEALHRILSGKVPVVNEEKLFNSIDRLVIDNDMYNTLELMFSGSMDDKKIACEILFNADYDKSYYNIYRLIKEHYYSIDHNMNRKNLAIFSNNFKLREIYNAPFKQDLDSLHKAGHLTEEIYYDILYSQAAHETNNIHSHLLSTLSEFFAADLFVKKSYEEYIESKKPKIELNEQQNSESTSF